MWGIYETIYRVAQKSLDTRGNKLIKLCWYNTCIYWLSEMHKMSSFLNDRFSKSVVPEALANKKKWRNHCTYGFSALAHRVSRDFCTTLYVNVLWILVNDQLDALFFNVFISTPLHVSSSKCSSSGGSTCINTPSGITHSSGWLSGRPVGRKLVGH